jgi:hypothetical protein
VPPFDYNVPAEPFLAAKSRENTDAFATAPEAALPPSQHCSPRFVPSDELTRLNGTCESAETLAESLARTSSQSKWPSGDTSIPRKALHPPISK